MWIGRGSWSADALVPVNHHDGPAKSSGGILEQGDLRAGEARGVAGRTVGLLGAIFTCPLARAFGRKMWLGDLPADITPHVLRHSFASLTADLGYNEATIASLLGHKTHSITSRCVRRLGTIKRRLRGEARVPCGGAASPDYGLPHLGHGINLHPMRPWRPPPCAAPR